MQLHLVDTRIDVRESDDATRALLRELWSEFVDEAGEAGEAGEKPRGESAPPDLRLRAVIDKSVLRPMPSSEVSIRRSGARFELTRHDFEATWDATARSAEVRYSGHIASFSSFLRVLLSITLRDHGGVLLHAASVRVGSQALLFPGVSGTGKSTIAGLASPRGVLSDEISAIRPTAAGGIRAYPTPFWGDLVRVRAADAAPLRAIVLLSRGGSASIGGGTTAGAAAALLEGALFFEDGAATAEKRALIAAVHALASRVPCIKLRFDLPSNPWPLLDPLPPAPDSGP